LANLGEGQLSSDRTQVFGFLTQKLEFSFVSQAVVERQVPVLSIRGIGTPDIVSRA